MKRIISCNASDFKEIANNDLKQSIYQSEGRVVMAECAASNECLVGGVSNAESLSAFGADLILVKGLDVENPKVSGIQANEIDTIKVMKELTGRVVGIGLEVVPNDFQYENGFRLSEKSLKSALILQPDFICLSAYRNPNTTSEVIEEAIKLVRKEYKGLLIINKYGSAKEILEDKSYKTYVSLGADIITLPMPGSVAGIQVRNITPIVNEIKEAGGLVNMSVSTSQEGSNVETIQRLAINSKEAGSDMYNFGDAHQNGMASVDNIMALSIAVRGKRHTYFRMASSIKR